MFFQFVRKHVTNISDSFAPLKCLIARAGFLGHSSMSWRMYRLCDKFVASPCVRALGVNAPLAKISSPAPGSLPSLVFVVALPPPYTTLAILTQRRPPHAPPLQNGRAAERTLQMYLPEGFLSADVIVTLLTNIADGMHVWPGVVRARVMSELPFMATENILMACVKVS